MFKQSIAVVLCAMVVSIPAFAQTGGEVDELSGSADGLWQAAAPTVLDRAEAEPWVQPDVFRAFVLDADALAAKLAAAPVESSAVDPHAWPQMTLPMPDGTYARFRFVEAPIMEPELAAKFPEIQTFLGSGIDDPSASVRFDSTPAGFHAQILSPTGAVYIDPHYRDDLGVYASYYKRDYRGLPQVRACELFPGPEEPGAAGAESDGSRAGETLRTYRLACAATGEYTQFHGGTVSAGMAAITTTVNRVVGIYETELAIRMVLVADNDQLVFTSSSSDPYSNDNGSAMLSQNQSTVDSIIGDANYDIGHVFSTGGGGVAYLGVVCVSGWKAGGVTGRGAPIGDAFDVDYVAHEMGHQYGGNHTFNGANGSCSGANRNGPTAYEPGSGSTIMAYAGICGADDLQAHSDPYFHSESIREIRSYVTGGSGGSCPATTATGNTDPVVSAGSNHTIPRSTPFVLTATGSDPDGDPVAYCWEERDLGPQAPLSAGDDGSIPLFRSWSPTTDPSRTFPRLAELLANTTPVGEQLPTTSRTMTFRAMARDQRAGGGGVSYDDALVTVDSGSGPFQVTAPNNGTEEWSVSADVTWNVAGTAGAPVNASQVDILLSTDGGNTFPITLASNTPNDGSETIVVPATPTTTARVRVAAVDNIFFDISNNNFTIAEAGALAIVLPNGAPDSLAPGVPTSFDVEIIEISETVVPGSPTLHYRYDGGTYVTAPLDFVSGDLYLATLPAAGCDDTPEFYISAEGDGGTTVYSPGNAPSTVYDAIMGTVTTIFADDFETDQGWTVTDSGGLAEGTWERGVPLNNDRGDPPTDYDGSGQCYLTENDPFDTNSDVDDGTTTVTSPVLDMSSGGTISYAYWVNDVPTGAMGAEDSMEVEIATDAAGTNWQPIRTYTSPAGSWRTDVIEVGTEVASSATLRIRFSVSDLSPGDVVEGGLDAFEVNALVCEDGPSCSDGELNQGEDRIDCGGPCPPCDCTSDPQCDNAAFCDGSETCDAYGQCQAGTNLPETTPCDDGLFCTATDECDGSGTCVGAGDPCAGGGECNSTCNEGTDDCYDPLGTACGDGTDDACTGPDTCDGAGSCLANHAPLSTPCDDGLFCTATDECDGGGTCVGAGDPCAGGGECNATCNEGTDDCFDPLGTACGDGTDDACTDPDTCDGAGSCLANHEPLSTPCDDGLFCTATDECDGGGTCVGAGDPCAGGGECNATCNEGTDDCYDPLGAVCGDGTDDACTDPDTCDGAGSCLANHAPLSTPCDDGLFCTAIDECDGGGMCVGLGDPCEASQWCDEEPDQCVEFGTGDFEPDGDWDLDDFAAFQQCFGLEGFGPCAPGNLTGDDAVIDLADFTEFMIQLTGP